MDEIVMALIDAAYDKKTDVRQDMIQALHDLGRKQPELVLSSCNLYMTKHQKLVQGHRVLILDLMKKIINDASENVSLDLAKELIHLASIELTKAKEVIPEWQTVAASVLVALGKKFSDEVMSDMLQKLVPGTLPHYFVVLTFADLAKENVFGVVPFLKDIFSRMLLMLGMVKVENLRWVFSKCIGSFSEAILDYCANIDNAPYADISVDRFYGEIFSCFEIMFNVWLSATKEAQVRLSIVQALGHMTHLMSKDKLEENIHRLIQGITGLYRRHAEHHIITESLCMVIDAASSDGALMLLPILDNLLNGLHVQACTEPDYSNINSVKNFNEVLRCFQVLTNAYPDKMVTFLQLKLEAVNEKSRSATVSIIRHLVNSCDDHLQDKKEIILTSVSIVLADQSPKVCKSFAQCIIAMAHHDYLGLEGGDRMIEFIVRMCSLQEEEKGVKSPADADVVTRSSLKAMCENILHLAATTVDIMENVLWPYLLECLIPVHYTPAMMALCRSLAHLAAKKREEDDPLYRLDYHALVNIPKPQALVSRMMVMAGHPTSGGGRGIHVLRFLLAMSPNIHPDIVELWDTVIPKLTTYLEENSYDLENWNQKAWEDLILKLLAKTLSEVDSEEWFLQLGREMGQQIPLYDGHTDEKNFLYKCLGVVLRKIGTTDFIREHLNLIFSTVDHNNQVEREGCAVGVGFCAASHLDQCLNKLEEITKTEMVRKATGFMGLLKDKTEADVERIKSTVMLCYGYVVFYGPPGLVTSRLEASVLRVINPHFTTVRDSIVKQNLIRAVELIGKAVQPSHLQKTDFIFKRRGDLLKHMQNFLLSEPRSSVTETRALAIDAITNLVKLAPALGESELQEIIKTCSENVYPIPTTTQTSPTKSKESIEQDQKAEKMMGQAVTSINSLMKEVSAKEPTPLTLQSLLKLLEPYMNSYHNHERDRVMQTVKIIFKNYLQNITTFGEAHFSTLGNLLGRMLPRCTDPVMGVRQNSMECVQLLLTINDRYEGVPANVSDERIEALGTLRKSLEKNEPAVLFNVVNELSVVISKKTPDEQLKTLVFSLIDGLQDCHSQSSSGACAILNCVMKFRGAELAKEVHSIVQEIVAKLSKVTFGQTITGSLVAMRTLASHHLIYVLSANLEFSVPFNSTVREFWKTLAKDKDLTSDTFDHILNLLNNTPPFTERDDPRDKMKSIRTATPLPMALTCALTEMFKVPECEVLVAKNFAKLLAAILIRMGCSVGVKSLPVPQDQKTKKEAVPLPITMACDCLREFLSRSDSEALKLHIEENQGWSLFTDEETFCDGLEIVAVGLCKYQEGSVEALVSCLLPSMTSLHDIQRMVPTAMFAELIKQRCCGDLQLVELLMNSLLSKLVDPSHVVRKLCIRGLGNVASVGGQKLQTYATTILSAMMAGMDDKEDPENTITLEAMSGLSQILAVLDESNVRQILINICLRIRPCFEKEKDSVRASAISLFGNLARFGTGPSEPSFIEQIHTNFVSILLHLNEEGEVAKKCKSTLRQLGPRLGSAAINDMFQKHLIEGGNLHYGEFMNDLSRLIISDHLDKVNFYVMGCVSFFKSNWADIRANAALFVGYLLGNLKKEGRENVSSEHACSALVMLLKDPSPSVRSRAAEAMSLLYDY